MATWQDTLATAAQQSGWNQPVPAAGSMPNPAMTPSMPAGYVGPAASGVDPVAINPAITVFTGPAPDYASLLANDPWYKQQLEWIDQATAAATAGGAPRVGPGPSGASLKNAEAQAALAREQLAHDHELALRMIREIAASRGVLDSGVPVSNTGEENFQFGIEGKAIDLSVEAARAALADARAAHAANAANAMADWQRYVAQTNAQAARDRGEALFGATERLQGTNPRPATMAYYVEWADAYQSPDGRWWSSTGQPISGPGGTTAAPAAAAPSTSLPYTPQPRGGQIPV